MLQTKPTEHLTGITIQGDYNDFYELVDSIYRITGIEDDPNEVYYGVKNRLLGMGYDIRHAYMGDRNILLKDNGMREELMEWHKQVTPTQNVYYSVNVLFPEAIFLAASVPKMYLFSCRYYGTKSKTTDIGYQLPAIPYSKYIRDKANLDVLCAGIWQALAEAISDEELEKIIRLMQREDEYFLHYATHYIDKCNVELLKTNVEKRKDKIRNIAKRIVKKPQAYKKMEDELRYWAKEDNITIYELYDPRIEYPEEIKW